MISVALYSMLLYRSYHGRETTWEVPHEHLYDKLPTAFGRMPIVLHLGDFLQLTPTGGYSLMQDFRDLPPDVDVPVEFQAAARLFLSTLLCYELRGTNRFKDCLLYTSPSPRDRTRSRMPSSA